MRKLILIFLVFGLAFSSSGQQKTSENNDKLKGMLKKYPEADKNKDGVIPVEAQEFIKSKKGRKSNKVKKAPEAKTVSGENVPANKEKKKATMVCSWGIVFLNPQLNIFSKLFLIQMLLIIPNTLFFHQEPVVLRECSGKIKTNAI